MRRLFAWLNPRLAEHEQEVEQVERRLALQERRALSHERRLRRLELEVGILMPGRWNRDH